MLIDESTFTLLLNSINKNGWLELPSLGTSMFPFIMPGNICRFQPYQAAFLQKGDIALYCTPKGRLVAHRFLKSVQMNDKKAYLFKGDSNLGVDQPIEANRIIGKLVKVASKKSEFSPDQFLPFVWGKMVLAIPLLSAVLRRYINKRNHIPL